MGTVAWSGQADTGARLRTYLPAKGLNVKVLKEREGLVDEAQAGRPQNQEPSITRRDNARDDALIDERKRADRLQLMGVEGGRA